MKISSSLRSLSTAGSAGREPRLETPDISVIIPAYNSESYLREAVKSVLTSTGVSIEVIIVDDASTDGTYRKARSLARSDPRVRIYRNSENIGQARTRNIGVNNSHGRYIAFLDSDDVVVSSGAYSEMLRVASASGSDMVASGYIRFKDGTDPDFSKVSFPVSPSLYGDVSSSPELVNLTSCWSCLYRRSFILANELNFSERLRQREDRPFITNCLSSGAKVAGSDAVLTGYRLHPTQTMKLLDNAQFDLFRRHMEVVGEYLDRLHPISDINYLDATALFYVVHIDRYWSQLILDGTINDAALAEFYASAAHVIRNQRPLSSESYYDGAAPLKKQNGYYDALSEAIQVGDVSLLRSILKKKRIPPSGAWKIDRHARSRGRHSPQLVDYYTRHRTSADAEAHAFPADSTLWLHVGMPKTGSSSIQAFLHLNRFSLYEAHGIYFPMNGLELGHHERSHRTSGHASLVSDLVNGGSNALTEVFKEVAALPRPPRSIVLSAENILSPRFWNESELPALLRGAFQIDDFRVIGYFRNQVDWFETMYIESITSHGLQYAESPSVFLEELSKAGLMDYGRVMQAWNKALNPEKMYFYDYASASGLQSSGGVVSHFMSVLTDGAYDSSVDVPSAMRNRSSSPEVAEVMRRLNQVRVAPRESMRVREALDRTFESSARRIAAHAKRRIASTEVLLEIAAEAIVSNHEVGNWLRDPSRGISGSQLLERSEPVEDVPLKLALRGMDFCLQRRQQERSTVRSASTRPPVQISEAEAASVSSDHFNLVSSSDLFDKSYYEDRVGVNFVTRGDAVRHYLLQPISECEGVSPDFSSQDYLAINPDVAGAGMNPLVHYLSYGRAEGRSVFQV